YIYRQMPEQLGGGCSGIWRVRHPDSGTFPHPLAAAEHDAAPATPTSTCPYRGRAGRRRRSRAVRVPAHGAPALLTAASEMGQDGLIDAGDTVPPLAAELAGHRVSPRSRGDPGAGRAPGRRRGRGRRAHAPPPAASRAGLSSLAAPVTNALPS